VPEKRKTPVRGHSKKQNFDIAFALVFLKPISAKLAIQSSIQKNILTYN